MTEKTQSSDYYKKRYQRRKAEHLAKGLKNKSTELNDQPDQLSGRPRSGSVKTASYKYPFSIKGANKKNCGSMDDDITDIPDHLKEGESDYNDLILNLDE